ncbi:MAG TPA: penicillin-binding transpeptidase domain-containing protein, partial [Longimicrobiales bacterium]|nr:penicillin-binding transpeptidase domain-containing protein [Longimicrobiales bacterium]
DGSVLQRRPPRKIRRVLPEEVTRRIGGVLVDVVEDGTGTAARLSTFRVAGKSGTSRAYTARGGYDEGGYFASFVGYFPAEDPQLVVFVKLERPRGSYFGGAAAAPVTRATLEAILAARRAPLDRRALIHIARRTASRVPSSPVRFASLSPAPAAADGDQEAYAPPRVGEAGAIPVPSVDGLPVRGAVRRLHGQGFRIRWEGGPGALRTVPGTGTRLHPGDTVLLRGGP